MLFNIAVKVASELLKKAIELEFFDGISRGKNGKQIHHLQYVDDTIIFINKNAKSVALTTDFWSQFFFF